MRSNQEYSCGDGEVDKLNHQSFPQKSAHVIPDRHLQSSMVSLRNRNRPKLLAPVLTKNGMLRSTIQMIIDRRK